MHITCSDFIYLLCNYGLSSSNPPLSLSAIQLDSPNLTVLDFQVKINPNPNRYNIIFYFRSVFVGSLPHYADEEDVRNHFAKVTSAVVLPVEVILIISLRLFDLLATCMRIITMPFTYKHNPKISKLSPMTHHLPSTLPQPSLYPILRLLLVAMTTSKLYGSYVTQRP